MWDVSFAYTQSDVVSATNKYLIFAVALSRLAETNFS